MVADKILDILDTVSGIDVSTVVGDLPSGETEVLAVMEYTSGINTEYFCADDTAATISSPVIKLVLRVKSYFHGVEIMDAVKKALNRYTDKNFMSILISGTPVYLGRGDTKLHEFQATFTTQIKE